MVETSKLEVLVGYSACDISDALLKLKVPGAGFLPDILPLGTTNDSVPLQPVVAPISTILFAPKSLSLQSSSSSSTYPPSNIPNQTHWTDLPPSGSIALLQQPPHQSCAVLGDILATRLKVRGLRGVVVDGRVRDVRALKKLTGERKEDAGFTLWNKGISTVGTGMEAQAWAWDVRIRIGGVDIDAGDILFADPEDRGVVVIPKDKIDAVLDLLPKLKVAEERVIQDVEMGVDVQEAFKRHRDT